MKDKRTKEELLEENASLHAQIFELKMRIAQLEIEASKPKDENWWGKPEDWVIT